MPYQRFTNDSLRTPFRPGQARACANFDVPVSPASRREPFLSTRFGFVGSRAGFDLLRFEAPTLALTPRTAPTFIAGGHIDALVLECEVDDLAREWGISFLDWASAGEEAQKLLRQAAEAGIPRIALLRGGGGHAALFAPLARASDHTFVTQRSSQDNLRSLGIEAELIAPAMQPALFHGFEAKSGNSRMPHVLSLDLAQAIDDPVAAEFLESITPFGLTLCSADLVVKRFKVETLPRSLMRAATGTVTTGQLRHLFASSDLLVQIAKPGRDPSIDAQHALNALASRCSVVVLGELDTDDPRQEIAKVFSEPRALRAFLSRFLMDPIGAKSHTRAGWRKAHRLHSADTFALRLAQCADPHAAGSARPRATVVCPTYRPERLTQVLETFRAQSWPDRELIVVANTDHPDRWDTARLDLSADEQIIFLSRRYGPGMALNLGAARGTGEYVLRMDDDDRYGRHYIEDAMLAAAATRADIIGQSACFYLYSDVDRLVLRSNRLWRPVIYGADAIGAGGHLAGFSHCVRRSLLLEEGYPDTVHSGADVGLLEMLSSRGDLVCLRNDGLNAVVERRSDIRSHTWQNAPDADDEQFRDINLPLASLLNDDLLAR